MQFERKTCECVPELTAEIEAVRLKDLADCDILDTEPEAAFDAAVHAASLICGMPISIVSFVDENRQWFKACVGLEISETPRSISFCTHAICAPDTPFVIEDTLCDERFVLHPLVTGPPHIRFYAGFPLVSSSGHALGTLCVIDTRPRLLEAGHTKILCALAAQITSILGQRSHLRRTERKLTAQLMHQSALETALVELEQKNQELFAATLTDPLTGIGNRRGFDLTLIREYERALRQLQPLSVIMIDIDFFKSYNDDFGHIEGDRVLIEVARILRSSVRAPEYLARYGGEEFVIILPASTIQEAELAAERIREAVAKNQWSHRQITISLGIATTDGNEELGRIVKQADTALYKAKFDGRNQTKRMDSA